MEVASVFNTPLVSDCEQKLFSLYFSWTKGRLSQMIKALLKYPFLLFSEMLMSAFLLRYKANYVEKMRCYPSFFFVDSNSPCKDLLFPCSPTWGKQLCNK